MRAGLLPSRLGLDTKPLRGAMTSVGASRRRKGAEFERAVVKKLKALGFRKAERIISDGREDKGDITGVLGFHVECKNHQNFGQAIRDGLDQAQAAKDPWLTALVIAKRPNKNINHAIVAFELAALPDVIYHILENYGHETEFYGRPIKGA